VVAVKTSGREITARAGEIAWSSPGEISRAAGPAHIGAAKISARGRKSTTAVRHCRTTAAANMAATTAAVRSREGGSCHRGRA
jgi:hypothetical protein